VVLGDDPRHLLLDTRQVGLADRLGKLEVVVEAVLDGRADRVLGARPQAEHGLRHDVRGGVAQDHEGLRIVTLERDDGDAVAVVQRRREVDEAGRGRRSCGGRHAARDGGFRQSRPDRRRRVVHGRAVVEFEGGAVGEGDAQGHGVSGPFVSRARTHTQGLLAAECSRRAGRGPAAHAAGRLLIPRGSCRRPPHPPRLTASAGSPIGYERSGDHDFSPYFRFFDWYDMASTDSLTLLESFRTTQQVTEWTCGPASLLMVRDWFDMNDEALTEIDLAQMRPDPTPGPTLVDDLTTVIGKLNADYGEDWVYFDMRQYEAAGGWVGELIPEVLSHGIPMMIAWDEWGGHWQVIIGYDDMGTSQTQDDVLVLADAYDTNDHNQDGYFLESYERLVYGWTFRMGEDGTFVVAYPASQFPDLDFLGTK